MNYPWEIAHGVTVLGDADDQGLVPLEILSPLVGKVPLSVTMREYTAIQQRANDAGACVATADLIRQLRTRTYRVAVTPYDDGAACDVFDPYGHQITLADPRQRNVNDAERAGRDAAKKHGGAHGLQIDDAQIAVVIGAKK